jgi:hypothetical protein
VSYESPSDRSDDVGFLETSIGYCVGEIICPQELSTILYDLSNNLSLKPVNSHQVSIGDDQKGGGIVLTRQGPEHNVS